MQPLVSIVLTSYNQPELLKRAFDSLINQTYPNIEIIIVDDCSEDAGSRLLINQLQSSYPEKVKAFFQPVNVGIPKNKNTGFKLASGEYITYLDGDDTYYENKIASEIKTFEANPQADVVYSNFDIKNFNGKVLQVWSDTIPPKGFIFKDIVTKNFPLNHFYRYETFKRQVLYSLNFYDEQFPVFHDLDFMLRYSLAYSVAYNNNISASYYKNPESIVSNTRLPMLIDEELNVYAKQLGQIKKHNLLAYYKKYIKKQELHKLAAYKKISYNKLISLIIKYPLHSIYIGKLFRYVNGKKANGAI